MGLSTYVVGSLPRSLWGKDQSACPLLDLRPTCAVPFKWIRLLPFRPPFRRRNIELEALRWWGRNKEQLLLSLVQTTPRMLSTPSLQPCGLTGSSIREQSVAGQRHSMWSQCGGGAGRCGVEKFANIYLHRFRGGKRVAPWVIV